MCDVGGICQSAHDNSGPCHLVREVVTRSLLGTMAMSAVVRTSKSPSSVSAGGASALVSGSSSRYLSMSSRTSERFCTVSVLAEELIDIESEGQ